MKAPTHAPVYAAAVYPDLAVIARAHGYALAVHGSLARDVDLIAVPWENAGPPEAMIAEMTATMALRQIGEPTIKNYGRVCYVFSIGWGHCFIDFSVLRPVQ